MTKDNFYIKFGTNREPIRVKGFDIDGTLTNNVDPFLECKKDNQNVCGLVSLRVMSDIFDFAEKNNLNPDFVCSPETNLKNFSHNQEFGDKSACLLKAKTVWRKAKEYTYMGDSKEDFESAKVAGYKFLPPPKYKLFGAKRDYEVADSVEAMKILKSKVKVSNPSWVG